LAAPLIGNATSEPAIEAPASAQPVASSLLIGSGDPIDVSLFDAPELSDRCQIDQNADV
jgi:protein involved in polysaccharide export with SLBB domain